MPRTNLCESVPRAVLDHRSREAHLRLERIERLVVPRTAGPGAWLRRLFCRLNFGDIANSSDRRPSRLPPIR
jgi:hypothetical protein